MQFFAASPYFPALFSRAHLNLSNIVAPSYWYTLLNYYRSVSSPQRPHGSFKLHRLQCLCSRLSLYSDPQSISAKGLDEDADGNVALVPQHLEHTYAAGDT